MRRLLLGNIMESYIRRKKIYERREPEQHARARTSIIFLPLVLLRRLPYLFWLFPPFFVLILSRRPTSEDALVGVGTDVFTQVP